MTEIEQLAVDAGLITTEYNGFDRIQLKAAEIKFAKLVAKRCAYLVNDYQRTTGYTDYARMLCKTFDIEFKEEDFWGKQ